MHVTTVLEVPETQRRSRFEWWSKAVTLGLLSAVLTLLLIVPIRRIWADVQVNYNEGWNSYRQQMVSEGVRLYDALPGPFTGQTGYPPVSFHVVAWLGRTGLGVTAAGRLVSIASLFITGILVGLIVRRAGADAGIAMFASLVYATGIAVMFPSRLGMNDPELLAGALTTAGLYFYLRDPSNNRFLCLSAAAFCLAGFTKQTMIAFPAAVALDLLLRSRKSFVVWAGAMIAGAGLLTASITLIDGRYFLRHLMFVRSYSYAAGWHEIVHPYLLTFQGVLLVVSVWAIWMFRPRKIYVFAVVISHALAFLASGGAGVDLNICFNAFTAAALACGIALADIKLAAERLGRDAASAKISTAVMVALAMTLLISVPGPLRDTLADSRALPARQSEFRSVVQFVRTQPGAALCESLLVCAEAGKKYEFYSLHVRDQIRLGRLDENQVLDLLRTHRFQTIQMMIDASGAHDANISPGERRWFTRNFMEELLRDYKVGMRTGQMVVYVPAR